MKQSIGRARETTRHGSRDEALFGLWERVARYHACETDAALRHLMEWVAATIDADNVILTGAVRTRRRIPAGDDPFMGWRLRVRRTLRRDTAAYRRQLEAYLFSEHYGKLTPTYYERSHQEQQEAHLGLATRTLLASADTHQVHRLRDGWLDFAEFKRSTHYRLYYASQGIIDRIWVGIPVTPRHGIYFLVDRYRRPGARRGYFSADDADLAARAFRGAPELLRRLFLDHGLFSHDKPFSPRERQVLHALLTGQSEKEIAERTGLTSGTLHQYVKTLYGRLRVTSRAALMNLWLDGGHGRRR